MDTYAIIAEAKNFVEVEGANTLKMMYFGGLPHWMTVFGQTFD